MLGINKELASIAKVLVSLNTTKVFPAVAVKNGEQYKLKLVSGFIKSRTGYIPHFYLDADYILVKRGPREILLDTSIDRIDEIDRELLTDIVNSVDKVRVKILDETRTYELFKLKRYLTMISPLDIDEINETFYNVDEIFKTAKHVEPVQVTYRRFTDYGYASPESVKTEKTTLYIVKDIFNDTYLYKSGKELKIDGIATDNIDYNMIATLWLNSEGNGVIEKTTTPTGDFTSIRVKSYEPETFLEIFSEQTELIGIATDGNTSYMRIGDYVLYGTTPTIKSLINSAEYVYTSQFGDVFILQPGTEIIYSRDMTLERAIVAITSIKKVKLAKTFVNGLKYGIDRKIQMFMNAPIAAAIRRKLFS